MRNGQVTNLYPKTEPYDEGMLDVGDGNLVYWELCGNPDGKRSKQPSRSASGETCIRAWRTCL